MTGRMTNRLMAIVALVGAVLVGLTSDGPARSAAVSSDDRASFQRSVKDPDGGLKAIFEDMPSYIPYEPRGVGLPLATITVTYNGFTSAAQAAFQRAVDIWSTNISSTVPIRVTATFRPLDPGVLGAAGPAFFRRGFAGAPVANTWFPIPTADRLAGTDLDPGQPDIEAEFSSTFNWYFGLDGNPGTGQFDFVSVVLHELGHGLGFVGSGEIISGGLGRWGGGEPYPFIFDRYVRNGLGQPFIGFASPSAALAGQLTGGSLFFASPPSLYAISAPARLYAPSTYEEGSTYSHLDEATFPAGNPNSLMTPQIAQREAIHDPGAITREIFTDIGWGATSTPTGTPGIPTNVSAIVAGTVLNVSWTAPGGSPVPTAYRLDFRSGSVVVAQVGTGPSPSIAVGIPPGTVGTFTVTVTAIAGSAAGSPSAPATFTIGGGGPGPCTSAPPTPTGLTGQVSGGVAAISFNASPGATSYTVQAGSQQGLSNLFNANIGNATAASAPVPAGFQAFVRVRANNACGSSAPTADFVLGLTLGFGDVQVTLSWNSTSDMDLHVIEPNGAHVYYAARNGTTARLDVDDRDGFGPENIFVNRGAAASGVYQFFIVHFSGVATTSQIQVRLNAGQANERFAVFSRSTSSANSGLGYNVADVNVGAATITERTGTRSAFDEREGAITVKGKQ